MALFLDFDTQHKKAERILQKISSIIYVPYCVVAEVTTILTYKHSKELANNFIAYVRNNKDMSIIANDTLDEMDFYTALPYKLSFMDSSLIFLSRKLGATLVTFDKQLERIKRKINFNAPQ